MIENKEKEPEKVSWLEEYMQKDQDVRELSEKKKEIEAETAKLQAKINPNQKG